MNGEDFVGEDELERIREITRLRKGLEEIKRYLEEREPRVGDALFACEALLAR